jgi:hypothetical protein
MPASPLFALRCHSIGTRRLKQWRPSEAQRRDVRRDAWVGTSRCEGGVSAATSKAKCRNKVAKRATTLPRFEASVAPAMHGRAVLSRAGAPTSNATPVFIGSRDAFLCEHNKAYVLHP